MGDNEAFAEYSEVIDFDDEKVPAELAAAARQFADAMLRAVKQRVFTSGAYPCETCTSACCGRKFSQVRLTEHDIERLRGAGIDLEGKLDVYDTKSFTGYTAQMRLVPWFGDEDEQACPFLEETGCSVYEHRPLVCREYSPWTCDIYEEDERKVDGTVHLRVVRAEGSA